MDPDEVAFAQRIESMERLRKHLKAAGDLVKLAEVDGWFRDHAAVIRRIRFQAEDAAFDN
uniref:Uncharacterized protein n=1 Tax=Caulobacter phage BL57 TaxID=3348355 RepID=A0AB74UMP7_9VIRU